MDKIINWLKKNYMIPICVVSAILLIIIFPLLEKKGTYSLDDNNAFVQLSCPEAAAIGSNINCDVILKSTGKNVLAVNANYDIPEGLEYVSFTVNEEAFELYSVDEENNPSTNGFAVVNLDGVSTEVLIGTLTLKVTSTAAASTQYTVELTNIELTDDVVLTDESYEMFDSDDASATVRTLSDVALLSNIEIADGTFDKVFSSDVFSYTVTVEANKSTVTVVPTLVDSNATMTGTALVNDLALHYGTNTVTIDVTSEDGNVTKTYTLNIYRKYEFGTQVYVYDAENEYIYTRNDSSSIVIGNIEMLEDGLHYNVNNNKLEVLYGNEVLVSIRIVNFDTPYLIANKTMYIDGNITYEAFMQRVTSSSLTFAITDSSDTPITGDEEYIGENYKLKVYYNSDLLDTYTLVPEYVSFGSLNVDSSALVIKRLTLGMTYNELLQNITTTGEVNIYSNDGEYVALDDVVKTGDTITIELNGETITYTLSVLGDILGTGSVGINDVGELYKYFRGRTNLSPAEVLAGDIFNDGSIGINDVGQLYKYFRGRDSLEGDD